MSTSTPAIATPVASQDPASSHPRRPRNVHEDGRASGADAGPSEPNQGGRGRGRPRNLRGAHANAHPRTDSVPSDDPQQRPRPASGASDAKQPRTSRRPRRIPPPDGGQPQLPASGEMDGPSSHGPSGEATAIPARQARAKSDRKAHGAGATSGTEENSDHSKQPHIAHSARGRGRGGRSSRFKGHLTDSVAGSSAKRELDHSGYSIPPKKDDLTSTLIHDLSTPPYPDCLICFSSIHPLQPTWSCSPLIPISSVEADGEGDSAPTVETVQYCWATFHLKCIKPWAFKSVKEIEEAWRARGVNRKGEWRCPGCQSKRNTLPSFYSCFCGSLRDPKPPRLATPHSCAGPCTRAKVCGHACALSCHPGPCPPCQVTVQQPCYCGKQTMSFRCANLATSRSGTKASSSCNRPCGKPLGCGNHLCKQLCHDGPCSPCDVLVTAKCYCGQTEKDLSCGQGVEKESVIIDASGEQRWLGRFECDNACNRPFSCGVHRCQRRCHPPSPVPVPCPWSPSRVTHCPCGKHPLEPSSAPYFSDRAVLVRTACTDPIPTCESTCMKHLDGCSHSCSSRCHTGPCPPCTIVVVRPCRCGMTTKDIRCYEDQARSRGDTAEILCDKPCTALRACGRHQCNRLCCPLASLALLKGKGKRRGNASDFDVLTDDSGWHECDLVCGKPLACGNHHCEAKDHRGACPTCLRSSFDELICNCGRTVLEPPIPCGTRISCPFPCARPPPDCGHDKVPHACHEDPIPCPPCPYLTEKLCACGKKVVGNVQCWQEKVSCGSACGKLLSCGFHLCDRPCHGDACGACHATCGKSRRLCLPANHPCTLACHAPAVCDESEPCRAPITLSCPCGRIKQQVPCARSATNPSGLEGSQQLKCSTECLVAKRNARLAEALGINADARSKEVVYSPELVSYAKLDVKFCHLVEKTFAEFISSDKRTQVLPHMPPQRRKFVHDLAAVYRMDTQMVDQEPHRSVQLLRRIDSRIPSPLLSASATPVSAASSTTSLGKLADLRAPVAQAPRQAVGPGRSQTSSPAPSLAARGRGWTSVVAQQPRVHPGPAHTPSGSGEDGVGTRGTTATAVTALPAVPPTVVVPAPTSLDAGDVPEDWEDDV